MFPQLFLTAFLSLMSIKCAGFLMCDSDTDCQDGSSCIENICKICVKCSLIFRKGNTCESDFNDCGDCLEGYKEISVTDNSAVKKPCKPVKKKGKIKECASDSSCPPNNYCSEESCVKCFDCSLINRLEPENCAKDPKECGPCLIGYLSILDTSRTNYKRCEKVHHDPVPYNIASGSVLTAVLVAIVIATVIVSIIKICKGFVSSKTIYHPAHPSAPPLYVMNDPQPVKYYNEKETPIMGYERQEMQQAKVFKQPCASYYPKADENSDEISVLDSGQNENSYEPDPPTSDQREETIFSHGTAICGEYAGRLIRSLSEVNSINSDTDSQEEQPVDMNVLNNDSVENNSQLVTEDQAQVSEATAKEPTEDLPFDQEQV